MKSSADTTVTKLFKRVVPIYRQLPEDRVEVLGSGCFFRREDDLYLVSAAHSLAELVRDPSNCGVPTAPALGKLTELWTLGTATSGLTATNEFDVGVLRLETPSVKDRLRRSGWEVLDERDVDRKMLTEVVILGWPTAGHDLKSGVPGSEDPKLLAKPFGFTAATTHPPETLTEKASPHNAGDIWMTYPEGAPDLDGISGAPIWVERERSELIEFGEPIFRVVAIQHSVFEGKYVRGTNWIVVDKLIAQLECDAWLKGLSDADLASVKDEGSPLWAELARRAREQPASVRHRLIHEATRKRSE